jgi:hypothetical protein
MLINKQLILKHRLRIIQKPVAMKTTPTILGNLGLQITFHFPRQKTLYRTITYPTRLATPGYGNRSCLNLTTYKAVNIACRENVIISVCSEVSESK